jgi:hypothetical protein
MRGSGSGSENKIANREPFCEPDHAANLVQARTCTENTYAVLSVKADLPDQSERLVEAYGSEGPTKRSDHTQHGRLVRCSAWQFFKVPGQTFL